jgi:hypothetical protein
MENVFLNFNKTFFKGVSNIEWFDKEGIVDLDDGRLAVITIDDNGTRDHYNGYWVEIISKTNGTIYKKFFYFKRHLEFEEKSSSVYTTTIKNYHAWFMDGNLNWYISTPKSTKPMVDTIFKFINKFL